MNFLKRILGLIGEIDKRILFGIASVLVVAAILLFAFYGFGGGNEPTVNLVPKNASAVVLARDLGATLANGSDEKDKERFSIFNQTEATLFVTGLSTSEVPVSGDRSVLNLKPKFTLLARPNLWSWQFNQLIGGPLTSFVKAQYGDDLRTEAKNADGADWTIWKSSDNRVAYAAVRDGLLCFGNDESAISAALKPTDTLLKTDARFESFVSDNEKSGFAAYVPRSGVESFSGAVAVLTAVEASDDAGARGFLASLAVDLLEKGIENVKLTSDRSNDGVVDNLTIKFNKEVGEAFDATMGAGGIASDDAIKHVPDNSKNVTRYAFSKPRLAYRSLVLVAANNTSPVRARMVDVFSQGLLASYGVTNAEVFLDSLGAPAFTFSLEDGSSAAVIQTADYEKSLSSLEPELVSGLRSTSEGELIRSGDEELGAIKRGNILIIGELSAVKACIGGKSDGLQKKKFQELFKASSKPVATVSVVGTAELALTETEFRNGSMIRTIHSKFGVAPSLLRFLAGKN